MAIITVYFISHRVGSNRAIGDYGQNNITLYS